MTIPRYKSHPLSRKKSLECPPIAHEVEEDEEDEVHDPLDADPAEPVEDAEEVDDELWLRAPVGVDLVAERTQRPRAGVV
eukprot:7162127-Pyramimonas_sp.AAC.1